VGTDWGKIEAPLRHLVTLSSQCGQAAPQRIGGVANQYRF
jgi:hypothetical protein